MDKCFKHSREKMTEELALQSKQTLSGGILYIVNQAILGD